MAYWWALLANPAPRPFPRLGRLARRGGGVEVTLAPSRSDADGPGRRWRGVTITGRGTPAGIPARPTKVRLVSAPSIAEYG